MSESPRVLCPAPILDRDEGHVDRLALQERFLASLEHGFETIPRPANAEADLGHAVRVVVAGDLDENRRAREADVVVAVRQQMNIDLIFSEVERLPRVVPTVHLDRHDLGGVDTELGAELFGWELTVLIEERDRVIDLQIGHDCLPGRVVLGLLPLASLCSADEYIIA